jgi:N6-adenosine-specific RNA methylase IME4
MGHRGRGPRRPVALRGENRVTLAFYSLYFGGRHKFTTIFRLLIISSHYVLESDLSNDRYPNASTSARSTDANLVSNVDALLPSTSLRFELGYSMTALHELAKSFSGHKFGTVLADPPWRFTNRTGKMAPEHRRLSRYGTMTVEEICALPVADIVAEPAHLYLWVPNALLPDGLRVLSAWGFDYKTNIVWHKIRKDGGPDGRGVGFYFRNVSELILFGVRGKNARTLAPGRRQVNYIASRKREHSRKPDEQYRIIEDCSKGPYLELFSRGTREGWVCWGDQASNAYFPNWSTYVHNSQTTQRLDPVP